MIDPKSATPTTKPTLQVVAKTLLRKRGGGSIGSAARLSTHTKAESRIGLATISAMISGDVQSWTCRRGW